MHNLNVKKSSIMLFSLTNKFKWFWVLLRIPNNSIKHQSFIYILLNVKTVLFQTIQLSISTQFSSIWHIDRTLWVKVDLGAMAMKEYSTFPNAPTLLEPHHQIVLCHIQDIRWGSLTPLQRSSRSIPQPQPTGQTSYKNCESYKF